ncbi:MAG: hypothetical protein IJQ00_09540 [Kiritimatiellae bacterium]|nr:hypothetical protein [Kiritimatiellia bacterium]
MTCDVVLFDLTSTYFEVDGTQAFDSALQRHGYSRDKRPDCLRAGADARQLPAPRHGPPARPTRPDLSRPAVPESLALPVSRMHTIV